MDFSLWRARRQGPMLGIVRLALSRPYTFVVMAILIAIFGARAAITTPTDIFPNIGIPVISVIWTYAGLPAGRYGGPNNRALRTLFVHDGQRYRAYRVAIAQWLRRRKNLLSAERQHQCGAGAGHVDFANDLKQLPAGITPPLNPQLQCVERADHTGRALQRLAVADET